MDQAIANLQHRFTVPSPDAIENNQACSICWTDYSGADQPVTLPCGHIFGEECILAWARGTTPTGRHNGCPTCRAELLPPSLYSFGGALMYWTTAIWQEFLITIGGRRVLLLILLVFLEMCRIGAGIFLEKLIRLLIGFGFRLCCFLVLTNRLKLVRWKWIFVTVIASVVAKLWPNAFDH